MRLTCVVLLALACVPCLLMNVAAQTATSAAPDYSGLYSFVKEGEFMQITLEEKGAVSGFISRYGDSENEKGTFLDQFIKSGTYNGKHLSFTTDSVHGVSYTFEGAFDRGPAKRPGDEGYYVLRGTLTRNGASADGKDTTAQSRQAEFRSFPRDDEAPK
jgi:hypothetical protein